MNESIESVLYCDPQAVRPGGTCHRCGGALYAPGYFCLRCWRNRP